MAFNLKDKAATWDATYVFPRPANEQYLSPYKAFLRVSKDASKFVASAFCSLISVCVLLYTVYYAHETFNLSYIEGVGVLLLVLLLFCFFLVVLCLVLDTSRLLLPYRLEFQRESHGGQTWATRKELMESDDLALCESTDNVEGKGVFLAPFKHHFSSFGEPEAKYQVFLSLKRLAQAMIIFGPPGSGKSSTFFIPIIRQFAACGGAIVLDVKGELFNFTAHYFSNVYRLDIMNPLYSDWFDLFGSCYRNPDLANRIAGYMVGYDPNKNSNKEPIWDQSAVSLLALMILYLCEKKAHPTPRDILRFLAENPKKASKAVEGTDKFIEYSPISEAFEKCAYPFAREIWKANFEEMPKDTFGGVKFNADTAITQLLSPKVNEILRPPTEIERKKGRRKIDFTHLRKMFKFENEGKKRGTAVYIVVSPSDAMNMSVFLRVVFSVALDTLRESAIEGSNVLVALDEAGNVPLSKLPEGINTDRSKGICYFLGYQDRNQPLAQYGHESAKTFLGTTGINIFLPGVDDDTAEIASKRLGETTILQRSSSDAQNNSFDSEKVSEAGRKLMMAQDLTKMKWFTQCVITIKGLSPIRTKIPNDAKMQDTRKSNPQRIVDQVSEEVLRLLRYKTGRESEIGKQFNTSVIPASTKPPTPQAPVSSEPIENSSPDESKDENKKGSEALQNQASPSEPHDSPEKTNEMQPQDETQSQPLPAGNSYSFIEDPLPSSNSAKTESESGNPVTSESEKVESADIEMVDPSTQSEQTVDENQSQDNAVADDYSQGEFADDAPSFDDSVIVNDDPVTVNEEPDADLFPHGIIDDSPADSDKRPVATIKKRKSRKRDSSITLDEVLETEGQSIERKF